ncbi:hypothetical protein F5Y18DRAFT_378694 [Xylariaceae sp. FL1019]|nr:hypothetical protein F5Y18DRAFT_378694 [Xylariaceae sp. FL1019]
MSIDLNWETLTGGPDGEALAERIRDFIHVKFQSVPLPRFIKSVTVHQFDFGAIPPSVVLKDLCDPLPDFYEEDYEESDDEATEDGNGEEDVPDAIRAAERRRRTEMRAMHEQPRSGNDGFFPPHAQAGLRTPGTPDLNNPFSGLGASTPGIPGGPSTMHYFQSKLGPAWSGTQTPLAAVAGAKQLSSWMDSQSRASTQRHENSNSGHGRHFSQSSVTSVENYPTGSLATPAQTLREKHSVSTLAPTSAGTSRPPTRDMAGSAALTAGSAIDEELDEATPDEGEGGDGQTFRQEPRPDDMQAVFRIKYAGDVRLELTAEILLDYPMPSFVGIPVKLNITGLTFDGVGVVAYIRKRVHFCFLSPEDALAAVGDDTSEGEDGIEGDGDDKTSGRGKGRLGGLLQEIRVESEIGQREGVKQSLKNVGKVEKFVLEQVRRIFEEEFVYPSFWTFLV